MWMRWPACNLMVAGKQDELLTSVRRVQMAASMLALAKADAVLAPRLSVQPCHDTPSQASDQCTTTGACSLVVYQNASMSAPIIQARMIDLSL
jgi:hypothetical protein